MKNTIKIKQLEKILSTKKRTIIFWCDEYSLQEYIFHSNGGNKYTEKVVFLLSIIKELKDSNLFSSTFIAIYLQEFKKNNFESLPEIPEYLDDLDIKLNKLLDIYKKGQIIASDTYESNSNLRSLIKLLEEYPENEDIIIEVAEIYRKNKEFIEALKYYNLLYKKPLSKYREISKIFIEIINKKIGS